jgi:cytochrome c-type biogenesis protein CcmH
MTVFWIITAVLCALALWALWRPMHSHSTLKMESVQQRNIAIANERAREIDSAFDAGDISAKERDQSRSDLETALADELVTSTELKDQFTRAPGYASLIALILVPTFAYGLYQFSSTYEPDATASPMAGDNSKAPSLDEIISRLEDAVNTNPEDQQGLFLLAQSYSRLGRYDEAALRFEQLLEIAGPDADLLVSYADNSAMANGRVFTQEMASALNKALQLNPEHISALWLGGVAAQQLGDPDAALRRWLTLRPMLTDDSESSKELEILISDVSTQLGAQRVQSIEAEFTGRQLAKPATQEEATPPVGITVSVSLSPELQAEVSDGDTVFIYAKAKSGPPMPLAASRQSASALPITVKLDDSMAMLPQMKLSNFEQVLVGARISKSGQAISQPGDLESELVTTSNSTPDTIELVISRRRQ